MSTPSDLFLSGTILSWTNTDDGVSYVITNDAGDTLGTTSSNSFDMVASIVAGANTWYVNSYSDYDLLATSDAFTYTPSTPSNLSFSSSILSWSNTDAWVKFKITNATGVILGTTSNQSFDMSASAVAGVNTWYVKSYSGNNLLATSSALTYTPSTPFNLSLSGSILSWSNNK